MGTIIEVGSGWYYLDPAKEQETYDKVYKAHMAQLEKMGPGNKQGEWGFVEYYDHWNPVPDGYQMKLQPGKQVELALSDWPGSDSVSISAHSFLGEEAYTEVKVGSKWQKGDSPYEVVTNGNVTTKELQQPPVIAYKLSGPEAVLQLKHAGVGDAKITNLPEPKVIVI